MKGDLIFCIFLYLGIISLSIIEKTSERLDKLNVSKNIIWSWVKAHNVDEFNNQVDQLARQAAETLTESSFN